MCVFISVITSILGDDGRHRDLQKLLLEGNEGQEARVEEAKQHKHSGQAEQHWDTGVLQHRGTTHDNIK